MLHASLTKNQKCQIIIKLETAAGNQRYLYCVRKSERVLIVAPDVKIGDNCNIFTGVTIGSTTRGLQKGVPIIGNEVWIGPNLSLCVGGGTSLTMY